jgi:hypothetical protein
VIGLPPSSGGVNATESSPFPAAIVVIDGAPGSAGGSTTAFDAADSLLEPTALVASTAHVYVLPGESELTKTGLATSELVPGTPPSDEAQSAVYPVIALPPLSAGGVNATETEFTPLVAVPMTGWSGTVAGTAVFDGSDGELVPIAFVAVTVHVYVAPLVSGDTTIGFDAPDATPVPPPVDDVHVAVYPVIALPPSFSGAVKSTEIDATPGVAVPIVGGSGTVAAAAATGNAITPTTTTPAASKLRAARRARVDRSRVPNRGCCTRIPPPRKSSVAAIRRVSLSGGDTTRYMKRARTVVCRKSRVRARRASA